MEEKYIYKCEYCGKVYDCRKQKHYTIDIPGEKFLKQTCSLKCAEKDKDRLIEDAEKRCLNLRQNTKIVEYCKKGI